MEGFLYFCSCGKEMTKPGHVVCYDRDDSPVYVCDICWIDSLYLVATLGDTFCANVEAFANEPGGPAVVVYAYYCATAKERELGLRYAQDHNIPFIADERFLNE